MERKTPHWKRVKELEEALESLTNQAGIVFDDPRIGYLEIQVSRVDFENAKTLLEKG